MKRAFVWLWFRGPDCNVIAEQGGGPDARPSWAGSGPRAGGCPTLSLSEVSVVNSNVVEDSDLYIHLRAYSHTNGAFGGLIAPSTGLTNIMIQVENVFGRIIGQLQVSSSLL